ncbi:MAG: maleylacetoacetate isomerase [Burkholderiales bacterium]
MKLYGFWRSLASFRVRIALRLKGIAFDEAPINLLTGVQHSDEYRKINPQAVIPALIDGNGPPIFQSLAILEYLDEIHPTPALLPKDARARARVRGLAQIVACDAHPLVVPRIRGYLEKELALDETTRNKWLMHWTAKGLEALEANLAGNPATGRYCQGDSVTLADICVVSQAVGAAFFTVDTKPYPTVTRILGECMKIDAFARSHPLKQPGAPAQSAH